MILPIGIEGHSLRRIPWVSIAIAAGCVLMFLVTWVLPRNPLGIDGDAIDRVDRYWQEHPNAELPKSLLDGVDESVRKRIERVHADAVAKSGPATGAVQAELDALADGIESKTPTAFQRLALVPKRGLLQIGWLTHMFLHFGWMHLIGNLFFFYLTGLILEDAFGRPIYAGMYFLGGLAGAIAQFSLDHGSAIPMAGASGAIATCMGGFALRYAATKVRFAYVFLIGFRPIYGTFRLPGWIAAGGWGAWEMVKLVTGGEAGVAVAAHVGGFLFGLAGALVMRVGKIEEKYVETAIQEAAVAWARPESLDAALDAFQKNDLVAARRGVNEALKAQPGLTEAELLLYRIDAAQGLAASASARLDRLVLRLLEDPSRDALFALFADEANELPATAFKPATALKIAEALETYMNMPPVTLRALFDAARKAPGADGARATIRCCEMALDDNDPANARTLREAIDTASVPAESAPRVETIDRRIAVLPPPSLPGLQDGPQAPKIVSGSVVGFTDAALQLKNASGNVANLAWQRVVGLAAALVPVETSAGVRMVPTTDLVLAWGSAQGGAQVVRLPFDGLALAALYPNVPAKAAYAQWLKDAVLRSGATLLPDAQAISRGEYPRYDTHDAMNEALYGATPLF